MTNAELYCVVETSQFRKPNVRERNVVNIAGGRWSVEPIAAAIGSIEWKSIFVDGVLFSDRYVSLPPTVQPFVRILTLHVYHRLRERGGPVCGILLNLLLCLEDYKVRMYKYFMVLLYSIDLWILFLETARWSAFGICFWDCWVNATKVPQKVWSFMEIFSLQFVFTHSLYFYKFFIELPTKSLLFVALLLLVWLLWGGGFNDWTWVRCHYGLLWNDGLPAELVEERMSRLVVVESNKTASFSTTSARTSNNTCIKLNTW